MKFVSSSAKICPKHSVRIRAPNGMGWDEKIRPMGKGNLSPPMGEPFFSKKAFLILN
jgi:hypothetical protein